ncbi:MAG: hypothetical protein F4029_18775 [Gammaproteobacteria bacterium]|nr:hypothetical protein [Gammaproteobacteria bacterium]MYF29156.1 hypothetical protein [Gammaproteobacteria bacterium]MYK48260.1 hypothetical protein [Gammaproteobacteria bacterium]
MILRSTTRLGAAIAAVAASVFVCADVEDRDWCITYTEHFEVVSDLPRAQALDLVAHLDRFRSAAGALLPGEPSSPAPPLKLVAFARAQDFATVFNGAHVAGFTRPSLDQSLLASGPGLDGKHLNRNIFHEYVHFLLRSRAALNLPIWYEEGFASYLATLGVDPTGLVTVGRVPYTYLRSVLVPPGLSIADVVGERFELDPERHDLSEVYGLAWAIVRFLHHAEDPSGGRYATKLGAMLAAIDNGASSSRAMESVLGLEVSTLKARLRRYFENHELPVYQFRTELRDRLSFRRDCLGAVDTRYHLADVASFHHPQLATALYDDILRREPNHIEALIALSRINTGSRASRLVRRAYDIDPNHPAAAIRMAELKVFDCQGGRTPCGDALPEAIALYTRALNSDSHGVAAAYGLGIISLYVQRPADALEYLLAAHARAPWSPQINFYLGEAYGRTGVKERARMHFRKTAYWHPDESWRKRATAALAKLGPPD